MKYQYTDLNNNISALTRVDRRLTISFGALILFLMLLVLFTNGLHLKGVMDKEEKQLSTLLTQILATSISRVSFSGRYHAQLLIEDTQKENPNIKYLRIIDLNSKILASSAKQNIGKNLTGDAATIIKNILTSKITSHTREADFNGENILEVSLPYHGGFKHTIQGVVQIGLSHKSRDTAITNGIIRIAIIVVLLLVVAVFMVRKISRHFGTPIQHLASDMATTLQTIPDLLFELDIDGRHLQIMTHQKYLLADARERLLGKTINEVYSDAAANEITIALKEAAINGESHGRQISLVLGNKTFWYELSVAKKFNKSTNQSHFIVLSRDITKRKKIEEELISHREHLEDLVRERTSEMELARDEAEKSNLAKSEFLSNMSHELRTPLNAIIGFSQLLIADNHSLNKRQADNVTEIYNAGHHLLKLINGILDLAKIEAGTLDIKIDNFSVHNIAQESIALIQPQLIQHNLQLINDIDKSEVFLKADPLRLKQIFLNLLSNAVKYNRDNGSIILNSKITNNNHLRLSITSHGEALTQVEIDKLFLPFERLSKHKEKEGTGIGLAICKRLIEAMGGEIDVESDTNKGNTFWIELVISD